MSLEIRILFAQWKLQQCFHAYLTYLNSKFNVKVTLSYINELYKIPYDTKWLYIKGNSGTNNSYTNTALIHIWYMYNFIVIFIKYRTINIALCTMYIIHMYKYNYTFIG